MSRQVNPTPPLPHPPLNSLPETLFRYDSDLNRQLYKYLGDIVRRVNANLPKDGQEAVEGDIDFGGFDITNLGPSTGEFYAEGSWTPGLSFGGGTTGIVYSSRSGTYTRVGRLVHVQARVALSNKGTSTGTAAVTGLPYAVHANSFDGTIVTYGTNFSGLTTQIGLRALSTEEIGLTQMGTTGVILMNDTYFTNTTELRFGLSYVTSEN